MNHQGKKIRANVPQLPEAQEPRGFKYEDTHITKRILIIGESTMAGVGVSTHQQGFAGHIASELSNKWKHNIEWYVYAKSGYTVKKLNERVLPSIKENEADLILIGVGANDAFELSTPWKWKKNIKKMIALIRARFPNTPVVFLNVPPIKHFPAFPQLMRLTIGNLVLLLGDMLKKESQNHDLVYYNSEELNFSNWSKKFKLDKEIEDYFSDGVHPSGITYEIWAKDMAQFIFSNVSFQ